MTGKMNGRFIPGMTAYRILLVYVYKKKKIKKNATNI